LDGDQASSIGSALERGSEAAVELVEHRLDHRLCEEEDGLEERLVGGLGERAGIEVCLFVFAEKVKLVGR